jgi:hypothetical protein
VPPIETICSESRDRNEEDSKDVAYLEGITIEEARARQQHLAHGLSRRPAMGPPMPANSNQDSEMAAPTEQLKVLQQEIKSIKEATIPKIDDRK